MPVHLSNSKIRRCEIIVADETVTLTCAILSISSNLSTDNHAEVAEGFIEQLLIYFEVKVAHEDIGPDILCAFILGCLIDLDGLTIELDHVHYLDGVICVLLAFELDEAVPLVLVRDFVARDMHVDHWSTLREEFPEHVLIDLLVEVSAVDSSLLVALVEGGDSSHTLIIMH